MCPCARMLVRCGHAQVQHVSGLGQSLLEAKALLYRQQVRRQPLALGAHPGQPWVLLQVFVEVGAGDSSGSGQKSKSLNWLKWASPANRFPCPTQPRPSAPNRPQ